MYNVIKYFSENLYALTVLVTVIALIIFFVVGTIKMKKNEKLMGEKRKEGEIDAPNTKKKFRQGETVIKSELKVKGVDDEE